MRSKCRSIHAPIMPRAKIPITIVARKKIMIPTPGISRTGSIPIVSSASCENRLGTKGAIRLSINNTSQRTNRNVSRNGISTIIPAKKFRRMYPPIPMRCVLFLVISLFFVLGMSFMHGFYA